MSLLSIPPSIGLPTILPFLSTSIVVGNAMISEAYLPAALEAVSYTHLAFLGIISSFLGIGGGPINLVVLFFFFSMPTKIAAENSLYRVIWKDLPSNNL